MDYLNHEVMFDGISVSVSSKKCFVLLSRGYQSLTKPEQEILKELIIKTVQSVARENIENIEITTDPLRLPPPKN